MYRTPDKTRESALFRQLVQDTSYCSRWHETGFGLQELYEPLKFVRPFGGNRNTVKINHFCDVPIELFLVAITKGKLAFPVELLFEDGNGSVTGVFSFFHIHGCVYVFSHELKQMRIKERSIIRVIVRKLQRVKRRFSSVPRINVWNYAGTHELRHTKNLMLLVC